MSQREINWKPKKAKAQSPGFSSQHRAIWVQGHTAVIPAFSGWSRRNPQTHSKFKASLREWEREREKREGGREGGN